MKIMEFNQNNYENLAKFEKLANSVKNIFEELADLEIKGQKDTPEYRKMLECLDVIEEVENKKYQEADLDEEGIITYEAFLNFFKDTNLNHLPLKIVFHNYNSKKYFKDNDLDMRIIAILNSVITEQLGKHEKLKNKIKHDSIFLLQSLIYLEQTINDLQSRNIRRELIRSKYRIIYIFKNIESILRKNEFDIPKSIEFNNTEHNNYSIDGLSEILSAMLVTKNEDFIDFNANIEMFILSAFLKSLLKLQNQKSFIERLNNDLKTNEDYHEIRENNTLAFSIVQSLIEESLKEFDSPEKEGKGLKLSLPE